jgi:Predicted hydrolases or acyltransferases (alpha/beta hydrolase superfamily)
MPLARSEPRTTDIETTAGGRTRTTDVHYLDAGAGDPVVLLHGAGIDAAGVSWKHVIPELAETHRVIAPDLPGHGESGKPNLRYTTEYYIDVLGALIEDLELSAPSLAGISMDGGIALGYALANEVDRLALVDSYGLGTDTGWRPAAATTLQIPVADRVGWDVMGATEGTVRGTLDGYLHNPTQDVVEDVHEILQQPGYGRAMRSWQRSEFRLYGFRTCYLDDLARLAVPTLLVHGANDTLFPSAWSERADERLDNSELHVFEKCGHWPPRERPDQFNDVLSAFMAT